MVFMKDTGPTFTVPRRPKPTVRYPRRRVVAIIQPDCSAKADTDQYDDSIEHHETDNMETRIPHHRYLTVQTEIYNQYLKCPFK